MFKDLFGYILLQKLLKYLAFATCYEVLQLLLVRNSYTGVCPDHMMGPHSKHCNLLVSIFD